MGIGRLLLCTFVVSLAAIPVVSAQTGQETDAREVSSYRLSEPALAKYDDGTHRLAKVLAENPPPCAEETDNSLSAMTAQLDAIPGASAAIGAAGMSSREYIVFMLAAFQAGMGAWAVTEGGGELPSGVSPENVAFFQAHEAELQELSGVLPEGNCEGGEEEGDWDDSEAWEDDGTGNDG